MYAIIVITDHFISASLSLIESYLPLSYVVPEPIVTVL